MNYSLQNLRQLMADSPAYQSLSPEEKDNIEEHIRLKNKPVLLYVFQKLQEEASAHQIGRENLAEKIVRSKYSNQEKLKLTIKKNLL